MSIEIIDLLKPKNGGNFPIVEAIDVWVEGFDNLADAVSHFATDAMIEAITAVLSGKANVSDVNTAVANLQGQIDQIVISASSEAVVAPEVAAARVGEDGTSYATLKERCDAETAKNRANEEKIYNAVSDITKTSKIEYIHGYYINLSGETADINSPTAYADAYYAVVNCSMNDEFTISGCGGNATRLWGFVDTSGNILSVAEAYAVVYQGIIIKAPASAAYLILNSIDNVLPNSYKGSFVDVPTVSQKSLMVKAQVNDIENMSLNVFNPNRITKDLYLDNNGNIIERTDYYISDMIVIPPDKEHLSIGYYTSNEQVIVPSIPLVFFDSNYECILATTTGENISIPANAAYFMMGITSVYETRMKYLFAIYSQSLNEYIEYVSIKDTINRIGENTDCSSNVVETRWYTGTTIGDTLTTNTASNTKSLNMEVAVGESYRISCTGGSTGRAFYFLDADSKVVGMSVANANLTNYVIEIPLNTKYLIVQTNSANWGVVKLGFYDATNAKIANNQQEIEAARQDIIKINNGRTSRTSATKYGAAALSRLKATESGVVNIGFIGDSWTQGTEDSISSGQFETYVKWLSKKLWTEYGFGGLGWLDFSRDGGIGKVFGCSDIYEHWSYTINGTISGLDGSTLADAPNCLGVCCAHPIFSNGSSISLTFDSGYLDKFTIRYYKNAKFSVSVNGDEAVTVTGDSAGIWQGTDFGTTGTDTLTVVITSLQDDNIIFGMDCFYGTKGVRCHKIGNRSLRLSNYLLMNENQFKTELASFGLSWVSSLFAINDISTSTSDEACEQIITNYRNFLQRVKSAYTTNNLVTCDISLLGCMNIADSRFVALPKLEEYECNFAYDNDYGWCSTRECIGSTKEELTSTNLFSDGIHLNKAGSMLFGKYIYKCLFENIGL